MKPTADIVEELRLYNRWRRGDEAITALDPTTLGKLIDDAADRIEHLFASGIHTCHDDCKRPVCVLRRERDKALADLAALRARVAELEAALLEIATYDTTRAAINGCAAAMLAIAIRALARAESAMPVDPFPCRSDPLRKGTDYKAAPANHPDNVIDCRDDADAARKQGGTP